VSTDNQCNLKSTTCKEPKNRTHAQDSIKGKIIEYLKEQKEFTFAGIVEDKIRQTEGSKASCVARRKEYKSVSRFFRVHALAYLQSSPLTNELSSVSSVDSL
jgi:hypothetical protein